jgi:hypothetical protein
MGAGGRERNLRDAVRGSREVLEPTEVAETNARFCDIVRREFGVAA